MKEEIKIEEELEKQEIIEDILSRFSPLTEEEQKLVLYMALLSYFECVEGINKSKKTNDKKLWHHQKETYLLFIDILTKNEELVSAGIPDTREFLLKSLKKDYNEYLNELKKASA